MLPAVYGPQHARVPPSRFAIAHDAVPTVARRLLAVGPDTASVLVGDGMLDIQLGRLRLCTPLTNVAGVAVDTARPGRSVIGVRLSPRGHGLILGTGSVGSVGAVCVRFARPVSAAGPAVVVRTRWVAIATARPVDLGVALLSSNTLITEGLTPDAVSTADQKEPS